MSGRAILVEILDKVDAYFHPAASLATSPAPRLAVELVLCGGGGGGCWYAQARLRGSVTRYY